MSLLELNSTNPTLILGVIYELSSSVLLGVLALFGHAAFWVGFVNRVHSTGWPRWLVKVVSAFGHGMLVIAPLVVAWLWWQSHSSLDDWLITAWANPIVSAYAIACWLLWLAVAAVWFWRHRLTRPLAQIRYHRRRAVDVPAMVGHRPLHGFKANLLSYVPSNQVLLPVIEELEIECERLPTALDGFSVVQLTDLHFTGRIGRTYFEEMTRQAKELQPDVVCLCGDLIDELDCLDWFSTTLAQLRAKHGVYFVLGNHDWFTGNVARVRRTLREAGLIDLSGRCHRTNVNGAELILAGNELPWFVPAADMAACPPRHARQFRILLSHSPDQFAWARRHDFDLMLAGHTHGGQIRLPLVGPIFSPSWHGVQFASGTFFRQPTLMHVSRGLSAELPLRWNCPPEMTKLILHRKPS